MAAVLSVSSNPPLRLLPLRVPDSSYNKIVNTQCSETSPTNRPPLVLYVAGLPQFPHELQKAWVRRYL